MARSSGVYTLPVTSVTPAVADTEIIAADFNSVLDDIETAIDASVYTDGLTATANLVVRTANTDGSKVSAAGVSVGTTGNDLSHTGKIVQPWVSLTCANGANADLTLPEGTNFYITGPSSTFSISGLTGGTDGRVIRLYNSVSFAMTITNDATSTAANRILTLTGADIATTTQGVITLCYSSTASRWLNVTLAESQASGGGGSNIEQGKHTIWVPATAMVPQSSQGPAIGTVEMTTNKNMFRTLDFDGVSTTEYAQFEIAMPKSWNEGTVSFEPVWSHPSTSTDFGVVWELAAVARSNDDAGDVAFGTGQISADVGGTTNDIYVGPEPGTAITIAGTPAEGDVVQFRIGRIHTNASDTMQVDARLHGIRLYITINAATDA